jgi:transcriptional regulator with XRE-family HTH domain
MCKGFLGLTACQRKILDLALVSCQNLYMEENALSVMVSQARAGRSTRQAAELCGLAEHMLRDIILQKTRRPTPATLHAIADGLGVDYEQLALAAYGIVHEAQAARACCKRTDVSV